MTTSKKSLPYVPWYHGDFLRSTAGWNLTERAAYWMLLCAQWEIGPLPDSPERLAAIVGASPQMMTDVWPVVGRKFERTPNGLVNERMEEHRANYLRYRAQQSENGKKGMEKRWGRRNAEVGHG
jgi:uncharacterized protein YdaU (DUF1376 family)